MSSDSFDVVVDRVFAAPIERVWRAWTDPEDLKAWWGPAGFTCPHAEVDARVGGRIFVTMRAPAEWGGQDYHNAWDITLFEPPHRLDYVMRFAAEDGRAITPAEAGIPADGVPETGEHSVVLSELDGGRTRLEMIERGYTSAEARDMSRAGLDQCLDKMATLVESGSP